MIKINKHIEIVLSTKRGLGSMSRESCNAIFALLSTYYLRVGVTIVNNVADLEALVADAPDLVFLGMKFLPVDPALGVQDSNKIWIAEYLERFDIACTGSGSGAHELEFDKSLAKQRVCAASLNTAASCVIRQDQLPGSYSIPLQFPLFVKPTNRGGGAGIDNSSVVHTLAQLQSKVRAIAVKLQADSLIEEYLPGREFSVAILKDRRSPGYLALPIELIAPDNKGLRLLSQHVKSSNAERAMRVTDEAVRQEVSTLALNVFNALGARDYGRIDIRLDASGTPQFLEANLLPSLITGYGSFPKACVLNIQLDYASMILRIAELGLLRSVEVPEPAVTLPLRRPAFEPV